MSDITLGKVIKSGTNLFIVDTEKFGLITCSARRNVFDDLNAIDLKKIESFQTTKKTNYFRNATSWDKIQNSSIIAGDICEIITLKTAETEEGVAVAHAISRVLPRINTLVRPKVANIDQIVAVLAPKPESDLLLVDKLIINAKKQDITVALCVNKSDLESNLYNEICLQYKYIADKIITVSAKNNDIIPLKKILTGKLSAFAGQSAVGKSSLVNALAKTANQKTNTLSDKIERGKNTTTRAEIIKLSSKTYIIDTPGFSALDIHGVPSGEIDLYYPEYVEFAGECKYNRCTHTVEPNCKVKKLIESGELNKDRYERYRILKKL